MAVEQKQPYVRFFASDWLAGTRGMSAAEIGVYITLIALMYERCEPLPDDPKRLARQCGLSIKGFSTIRKTLIEEHKIEKSKRGLWNKRVEKEFTWRKNKSTRAKEAADERWGKSNQNNEGKMQTHSDGNANGMPESMPNGLYARASSQKPEARIEASAADTESIAEDPSESAALPEEPESEQSVSDPAVDPAVEIITAFDDQRAKVFGESQRRPWPTGTDLREAQAIQDAGVNADTAGYVFRSVFERQKSQNQRPAGSLRYMRDPIAEALTDKFEIPPEYRRTANGSGRRLSFYDNRTKTRVECYRQTGEWSDEWIDDPHGDREACERWYDQKFGGNEKQLNISGERPAVEARG